MKMKNTVVLITMIATLIFLGGCAGARTSILPWAEDDWAPQNYAGLTRVELKGCDQEQGIDGQLYCDINIYDGKEKTDVSVVVKRSPDGTITAEYNAKDVAAFEGQLIRGDVEKKVAEKLGEVIVEAVNKIPTSPASINIE